MNVKKILFGASVYQHLNAFHKPFIKWFQDKGYEVHAVGSDSLGGKKEIESMGVVCHEINFNRTPFAKKNIEAIKQLRDLFKNYHYDLIHVHTPTAAFLIRYVAKEYNQGKIVYTAHGFHFFKGSSLKNWLLFYPAEKLASKWTDTLIVMNEEDFISGEKLGFTKNKNLFLVNGVGVDLNEYAIKTYPDDQSLKKELNIEEDAIILTCIAELSKRKNQFFLLRNWSEILKCVPKLHLLLVGRGPDEIRIKEYIQKNDLKNIHLLGYRKDIPKIISSSDIITLISTQEGLPRCLMESMALGKSIITTNIRGSRDLVENGVTGLVVNLDDNNELIKSVLSLSSDKKLRDFYGGNSHLKIQEFSIEHVLENMINIYEELL